MDSEEGDTKSQINFVSPSSESTPRSTASKLSLVPPPQPQLSTRKADTPRPKETPKQIPFKPISKSASPKMMARNNIQDDHQEVRFSLVPPPTPMRKADTPRPKVTPEKIPWGSKSASPKTSDIQDDHQETLRLTTPVKRGCTSPRKDVDSPVKMLNPLLRMRGTPKKEAKRPESSPEVFLTPPPSAVSHSFLEKSPCQGESGGFFDGGKEMSVSADLFGESEQTPLGGEESFLGGGETPKSHVSSGSGFFSSNPGDGKIGGSFFDEDGTEDQGSGSFSLFFDGEKDEGASASGGFSLF